MGNPNGVRSSTEPFHPAVSNSFSEFSSTSTSRPALVVHRCPHHQPHPDLSLPQHNHHPRRRGRSLLCSLPFLPVCAALPAHRRRHRHQPLLRSPAPVSRLPFLQRPSRRCLSARTRRLHRSPLQCPSHRCRSARTHCLHGSLAALPVYRHRHHQPRPHHVSGVGRSPAPLLPFARLPQRRLAPEPLNPRRNPSHGKHRRLAISFFFQLEFPCALPHCTLKKPLTWQT